MDISPLSVDSSRLSTDSYPCALDIHPLSMDIYLYLWRSTPGLGGQILSARADILHLTPVCLSSTPYIT